jgi:type II secretory pathway pseudopilin PulG
MRKDNPSLVGNPAGRAGFSLVETTFGLAMVGVMFTSFFTGLSQGFNFMQTARENLRATEILAEKMDSLRLYSWEQITTPNGIPRSFTVTFTPTGRTPGGQPASDAEVIYEGTIQVNSPTQLASESYKPNLREVTVTVCWGPPGEKSRKQVSLTTFVAQHGMQKTACF